ncbi:MAG TPA: hypothetical protein VIA18_29755, partial [Polyangia bacterium]|nr:hypothetical protein [Polyangia bacterium]
HNNGQPLTGEDLDEELRRVRDLAPTAYERYRTTKFTETRFDLDCESIGLRPRRVHDMRRTLNSLLVADGGRDPIRGYIVWGPGKKVSDIYTTLPWETFCEEMVKLKIRFTSPAERVTRSVTRLASAGFVGAIPAPTTGLEPVTR